MADLRLGRMGTDGLIGRLIFRQDAYSNEAPIERSSPFVAS